MIRLRFGGNLMIDPSPNEAYTIDKQDYLYDIPRRGANNVRNGI